MAAVICVLHGICLGLAIDLSCCADVRICAKDSRFAVKEVDIGLAADIGTLSRLPKLVSSFSWVKDVCLSARDFGAEEALSQGFVSQVHESKASALAAAVKLATFIAAKSPVAVQGTKELLNYSRDHPVDDSQSPPPRIVILSFPLLTAVGLRYTQVWNSAALQSSDFEVALRSGLTKTKPTFEKL